jgi:hypothetical protein
VLKNVELVERTSAVVGPSATVAENSWLNIFELVAARATAIGALLTVSI